jgi:hypothetical protein
MVWNKAGRQSTALERASDVKSYPTYNMEYLRHALGDTRAGTKYEKPDELDQIDQLVYQQKAASGFRGEANQALQNEFSLWLQGQHIDNTSMVEYDNTRPGVVERRHFMDGKVGAKEKWKPTWWGKAQLTHLPGVRDYLVDSKWSAERDTMDLNQLAEFGPQNIEQAWAYFKTWVKGMPISEAVTFNHAKTESFDCSSAGPKMPSQMMLNNPLNDTDPTATDTQWRYQWRGNDTNSPTPPQQPPPQQQSQQQEQQEQEQQQQQQSQQEYYEFGSSNPGHSQTEWGTNGVFPTHPNPERSSVDITADDNPISQDRVRLGETLDRPRAHVRAKSRTKNERFDPD